MRWPVSVQATPLQRDGPPHILGALFVQFRPWSDTEFIRIFLQIINLLLIARKRMLQLSRGCDAARFGPHSSGAAMT